MHMAVARFSARAKPRMSHMQRVGTDRPISLPLRVLSRHAIPGDAWRKIIDFCGRDTSFCHLIIPKFQNDCLVLLLLAENGQSHVDKAKKDAANECKLQALAADSAKRPCAFEKESWRVRPPSARDGIVRVRPACPRDAAALAIPQT